MQMQTQTQAQVPAPSQTHVLDCLSYLCCCRHPRDKVSATRSLSSRRRKKYHPNCPCDVNKRRAQQTRSARPRMGGVSLSCAAGACDKSNSSPFYPERCAGRRIDCHARNLVACCSWQLRKLITIPSLYSYLFHVCSTFGLLFEIAQL